MKKVRQRVLCVSLALSMSYNSVTTVFGTTGGDSVETIVTEESGSNDIMKITAEEILENDDYEMTSAATEGEEEVYVNSFDDDSVIETMSNISSNNTEKLSFSNGLVVMKSTSGDKLYKDINSLDKLNGSVSVDLTSNKEWFGNNWRTGVMFRAIDTNNYSWVGIEGANTLRIRENIQGVSREVVVNNIKLPGDSFNLKVYYNGDKLLVYANDTLIYSGLRPHVGSSEPTNMEAVSGQVGIMGWSRTNATFDNLSYSTKATVETPDSSNLVVLENDKVRVRFNESFPVPYDYTIKSELESTVLGSDLTNNDSIMINSNSYVPKVEITRRTTDSIVYAVTLDNVTVGNVNGKTITFNCVYTLTDTGVKLNITDVIGDEVDTQFLIKINSPLLTIPEDKGGAITTGGTNGNNGNGGTTVLSAGDINKNSLSFVFAHNNDISATIYTKDQWNRPYSAYSGYSSKGKVGKVYSDGYYHRVSDGVIPVKDTSATTKEAIGYEMEIYLSKDNNMDGAVDWMDSALWVRKQIPQLPEHVREFFNGGSWVQTHMAFPGNGNHGNNNVANYQGFTTVRSEYNQLLDAQRQIANLTDGIGKTTFETVGWNGRGHDYGWPSINEVYFNPALGTDEEFIEIQKEIKQYGGDLSFHVNMTDMTDNSPTYLRGDTESPFGNRAPAGRLQYGENTFGWNAYKICHFMDLPYALNRIDAFIGTEDNVGTQGRFLAPKFLYSDVMLDYPKNGYTNQDEQYAKFKEVDRWSTLGTEIASEYYYSEKRTGGVFLMKNFQNPNNVDQFINAGQSFFSNTRGYKNQAKDYIWASLCSDDYRSGNAAASAHGNTGNQLSSEHTAVTFLLSYLNGFVANNELIDYVDNGNIQYTQWSNDVRYSVDNSNSTLKVTQGDITIADLSLNAGVITGDSFIPAYDGTERVFAFSSNGGTKTFELTSLLQDKTFKLYRLSESGRVLINDIVPVEGKVTLEMEEGVAYVLDYSESEGIKVADSENLALTADVTASSSEKRGEESEHQGKPPVNAEELYVTRPDGEAWKEQNDELLQDLTSKMFKDGDPKYLRYYRYVISGFSADGIEDTYWKPTVGEESHWINYSFTGGRKLSSINIIHDSSVDEIDGVIKATLEDGTETTVYEGKISKDFNYKLDKELNNVTDVKVEVNNAADKTIKLCEVRLISGYVNNEEIVVSKVQNLKAEEVTNNSAKLTWNEPQSVVGLTDYIIYKDGKEFKTIPSKETEVIIENLKANSIYGFKISAKYSNGEISKPMSINLRTKK